MEQLTERGKPEVQTLPTLSTTPYVVKGNLEVILAVLQAKPTWPWVSHRSNVRSFNEPLNLHHRIVYVPTDITLEVGLGILPSPPLIKRGDHHTRATDGTTKGGEKYMSSRDMYRHLNLLQELVPVGHESPD